MHAVVQAVPVPAREVPRAAKGAAIAGWIIGGLPALMLVLDGVMKLVKPEPVIKATVELGYPQTTIIGMGIAVLVSAVLYLIPGAAVLGAILLTGYLGGAVASHVRAGHEPFNIAFPVIFGVLLWLGLYLRDRRLRVLVPWRR